MSLILLEKQGEAWRSRVEGHFILGAHPIETLRKGLPEAMAQAVVDHCAMAGEDAQDFMVRLAREVAALAPVRARATSVDRAHEWQIASGKSATDWPSVVAAEPRPARVPRKPAMVAPEAEPAPVEPVAASEEPV